VDQVEGLIARSRKGCLESYGELVRRFQDMAYGYALSVLSDTHLAEDATQEAFVAAYESLNQLREPRAFPGWLRRVVAKQCDRLTRRKQVRTQPLHQGVAVPSRAPNPAEAAERSDLRRRVLEAVAALPGPQRTVTTLFYIDGYSQNDIAEFLDVPVATVKNRLRTSRTRLKERMVGMVKETLNGLALPEDFADVVVRRVASKRDLRGAQKFLGSSYHGKRRPQMFETLEAAQGANIYIVGPEGGEQTAGFYDETELGIGSTVLQAARPREMAGEAEGVPSPVFVKGFQGCFRLARDRGTALAVVHGSQFDHAFCGFVPCFYYPVATLPCARAKSIDARATIREALDGQEKEAARQAVIRDPYAVKISAMLGGGPMHVVECDGQVVGYVRVDRRADAAARKYGMSFGYVTDMSLHTRDAALAVIKLAGELTEQGGDDDVCILQSHMTLVTQVMVTLGGQYLLRPASDVVGLDAEMVAVIDLPMLSQQLHSEFQRRLDGSSARGRDTSLSIEMGGAIVGFVLKGGRLEVVQRKQPVHRVLPRWITTRLYMGYYSGKDVLTMGPLPWDRADGKTPDDLSRDMQPLDLPEAEGHLFEALFPRLWPCAMPDPDVWPWVLGKDYPRYQNEQAKTPDMKGQIDSLRFPWLGY